MNPQTSLTAAKIRRILLITALALCPFVALQSGHAQGCPTCVATATLTSGGLNNITIGSNGTFTLTLGVTTNFISSGYTVFYSISANGLSTFGIPNYSAGPPIFTPRTNLNAIMNDPTTSDAVAFNGPGGFTRFGFGPGSNSNQFDLGYTGDQVNNQAAGTFALQSIMFSALNAAPGTYTIFLDARSIMTEHNTPGSFNDVNMGNGTAGSPIFTINVVPEPATIGLALVGGALLLLVIYRKQRARA